MHPSVYEQPKHAYGSHNPSYPTHAYPQPAVTIGIPAGNAYSNTNNYDPMPPPPAPEENRWTTGLCSCGEDCCSCMYISISYLTGNAYSNTNNYHPMPPPPAPEENQWTTGLCSCGEDCFSCWLTYFCPCIAFGEIAEILDQDSTSCAGTVYSLILCLVGYPCLYSCSYRTKLRKKFNLEGDRCTDCLVHCFCETCALCQEYRELKKRGFDPALGWAVNQEMQDRTASAQARTPTAPPVGQAMNR